MGIKLLVIADDFTGALDTGVQLAKLGMRTSVSLDFTEAKAQASPFEALVVDTETRHLPPETAYGIVAKVCRAAQRLEIPFIYKKTDSTLRGPIGAEFQALADVFAGESVHFIPAYPQLGRTTLAGCQYVDGVPLNETPVAKDPLNPIRDADIRRLLGLKALDARVVAEGERAGGERAVYIYDCGTQERLGLIARGLGSPRLTAGCAGFARYLPELIGIKTGEDADAARAGRVPPPACRLIVSGSLHANSLAQTRYAERNGAFAVLLGEAALAKPSDEDIKQLVKHINGHEFVILKTAENREDASLEPLTAAHGVAVIVRGAVERLGLDTLVVFGGDTAVAIARELGCTGLEPLDELAEGIPLSVMTYRNKPFYMVTKAGGFGGEDAVGTILEKFPRTL